MVLQFNGHPATYSRLLELLGIDPDIGAPAANLLRLADLDVDVAYRSGTLADIAAHIARGEPCIAFVHTVQLR